MKIIRLLSYALAWGFFQPQASAQFASDAGLGQFGAGANTTPLPNHVKGRIQSGLWFGSGQYDVAHWSLLTRVDVRIGAQFILYTTLPVQHQAHPEFGAFTGVSNPSVVLGYELPFDLKANFTINAGFQFPGENANRISGTNSLPMVMQPSLGSTDLLLGFTFEINNLLFSLAYQRPLTDNQNQFIRQPDAEQSLLENARSSYALLRGQDLALRFRHRIPLTKKLGVFYHLMPIIRLQDDQFLDFNKGTREAHFQSKGLTVNASAGVIFEPATHYVMQIEAGLPLRYRNAHADGTLRYFFAGLTVQKDLVKNKKRYKIQADEAEDLP
jgi:hypothetical protein